MDIRLKTGEEINDLGYSGLKIIQRKGGYRYSLDAVLLSSFIRLKKSERLLDLCAGNGAVSLLATQAYPRASVWGMELQEELADQARRSAILNKLKSRVQFISADVKSISKFFPQGNFQALSCNPPYRSPQAGKVSPVPQIAVAKHEICCTLEDIAEAARYALAPKGRAYFIHQAPLLCRLLETLRQKHLEPKRLRMVHSRENMAAEFVLVEALAGGRLGAEVLPPLVIYKQDGKDYTDEMARILGD